MKSSKKSPRGAFKRGELDYIKANRQVLTTAEMAAHLGRAEETVARQVARLDDKANGVARPKAAALAELPPSRGKALASLHDSPSWQVIRQNFTPPECRYYEEQYCLLLDQFGEDVLATEFLQVDRLVTILIKSHRALAREKDAQKEIHDAERDYDRVCALYPDVEERDPKVVGRLAQMQDRINGLYAKMERATREFRDLDDNQQKLMLHLKGTREQRVKDLSAKKDRTFADLLRELKDVTERRRADREASLVRLAAERKRAELAKPQKFADDFLDRPLLCPELLPVKDDLIKSPEGDDGLNNLGAAELDEGKAPADEAD